MWKVALNTIKQTNNILCLLTFAIAIFVIKKGFNEHYGTVKPVFRGHPWEKEKIAL